ncbi:hypothetical protein LIER_34149 [Lithospermum erythrorhizon]|uniref:RNase H type-1 domain-containing protein n=1 Tax=Lithospermum erythrorhizon TaxID=34254 RepID=A0AAV3RYP6_LITER
MVCNLLYYIGRNNILSYNHCKGWHKPPNGIIKLNVDETYKNGVGGLGGILRNCQGHMIATVGIQACVSSSLDAEIQVVVQLGRHTKGSQSDMEARQKSTKLKALVVLEGAGLPYVR